MADTKVIIGVIAAVVSFAGFIPYLITILKGNTRPNIVSWTVWMSLACISGITYYYSGARQTALVPAAYVMGDLLIITLALKHGKGDIHKFDLYCLAGSGLGLILWWIFHSPVVGLAASLLVHLVGSLPALKKAYQRPRTESRIAWTMFSAGIIISLFAIKQWRKFGIVLYPVYMSTHDIVITSFVFFSPKRKEGS